MRYTIMLRTPSGFDDPVLFLDEKARSLDEAVQIAKDKGFTPYEPWGVSHETADVLVPGEPFHVVIVHPTDGLPLTLASRTDWSRLGAMTEAEIEANAQSDPDNPPLTDSWLKGARVEPEDAGHAAYREAMHTVTDWQKEKGVAYEELVEELGYDLSQKLDRKEIARTFKFVTMHPDMELNGPPVKDRWVPYEWLMQRFRKDWITVAVAEVKAEYGSLQYRVRTDGVLSEPPIYHGDTED